MSVPYLCQSLGDMFWSESIWLPPNTTWADVDPNINEDVQHTVVSHLLIPLPMAILILALRYLIEKYWFAPLGILIGIKNTKPKKAPYVPQLEEAYSVSKKWNSKQIEGFSKQLDMNLRQIERWLRIRKGQDRPTTLVKFCENSWRCLYFIFIFSFGVIVLWDKAWLWDIQECWRDFPHQSVTSDVWWYYMVSLAFYCSLCVSQFFDVKRKDFWEMFLHHIATITLMCLSWTSNAFRIGTLVLLCHDCTDIFLEAAKIAKYAGYQKLCDVVFVIFTLVWIITRMGFFPFWIIKNTLLDAPRELSSYPVFHMINILLIALLILHCFWTYLILKIVYNSLKAGQMDGDIRSSSDECSDVSPDSADGSQ